MNITAKDGTSFSLHVERYEFPDEDLIPNEDNPADDFDTGRMLVVRFSANHTERSWNASGPEMDTTELARLADWLDSVVAGNANAIGVYFTERDLEFTVSEDLKFLRIHFFWDFLPPWIVDATGQFTLDFQINEIDLSAASRSLREQLVAFPGAPEPS
jgi:hypothetical protein